MNLSYLNLKWLLRSEVWFLRFEISVPVRMHFFLFGNELNLETKHTLNLGGSVSLCDALRFVLVWNVIKHIFNQKFRWVQNYGKRTLWKYSTSIAEHSLPCRLLEAWQSFSSFVVVLRVCLFSLLIPSFLPFGMVSFLPASYVIALQKIPLLLWNKIKKSLFPADKSTYLLLHYSPRHSIKIYSKNYTS